MLDQSTQVYGKDKEALQPVAAALEGDSRISISYEAGAALVKMIYEIKGGYAEVRMPVPLGEPGIVSFPGSFLPEGENLKFIIPVMQGMLWDGRGEPFERTVGEGGHLGFAMPLIGYLGEKGGLLYTAETQDDVLWSVGKDEKGKKHAFNLQAASLGTMRYERIARLIPVDPDIVKLAKAYRMKIMEQKRFKGWEEKISERPDLERLFGALMCFIGYCEDGLDYAAECRKLKKYGFDRALVYPGRFNMYYPDILMGGKPAINLSRDVLEEIKALGYDVAPWSWLNEALDDGTEKIRKMYRKNAAGEIIKHWAIEDQQWYQVCSTFLEEYQKAAIKNTIPEMTWDHFDVLTCASVGECYATDHPNHRGKLIPKTEDREWIKKALRAGWVDGRAISSEYFNDAYSLESDFGSVKAWPQYGPWPYWPIPLTMLVYHDSIIHSWWELHSYNNAWRGGTGWLMHFEYGGGRPRLMASMDALYGCPPDVFPFGSQYGYTGEGQKTFLYKYRFEDPEVQIALREALPVAELHKKIGKLEMVDFKILSEDGYLQQSAFADGTGIIANFSRDFYSSTRGPCQYAEGIGTIGPESWKIVK